ncbi:MAG: rhodanese-like domain-containing protein [Acidimicrobiia bacterium]|nr:rhodanese-like domain-containing protein [Acidimicrobiia bacterium]
MSAIEPLVSTDWLAGELAAGAPDLRLFDCTVFLRRPPGGADTAGGPYVVESGFMSWAEGHIPGSGFIDLVAELSDPDSRLRFTALSPDRLATAFAARAIGEGTRVVLYDRAVNMWATRVWWLLRSIGVDDAAVLDGGLRAWKSDGRDLSTEPASEYPAATLVARPRPEAIVGRAEVEAATTDDRVCLVNALSPELHSGADASYGRAGHIPGSTNVYAAGLVDPETHRYKPLDELRATFEAAGVTGGRIVTWCGGGIAATSDAFILHRLGHNDLGIYDGSLSEWIAAGLPLEV